MIGNINFHLYLAKSKYLDLSFRLAENKEISKLHFSAIIAECLNERAATYRQ